MDTALEQQEQTLDFRKYINIVLLNWWIIIIPPIITTIAATIFALNMPKVFEASSVILVENRQLLKPLVSGLAVSTDVSGRISTLQAQILSWPILTQLLEELGIDKELDNDSHAIRSKIEMLQKKIHIRTLSSGSSQNKAMSDVLLSISYEDQSPHTAQKIVKAIGDVLIARNLHDQSAEADDAISFIEKQLEDYRLKLEKSEDELRKFQEAYTVSLPVAARVNEQIIDLEIELNQLLIENTESHPSVIAMRKKIAQLKGEREKEIQRMESQGVNVRDQEFQAIAYSVPRQHQELARLQRDTQVNAKLYAELLQRLESAKISKRLESDEEGTRFKVIEPPRLPYKPIKPNVFRLILFGCAIGFGLGGGIVFLKEVANQSFQSVEEAKRGLTLPILGAIPTIDLEKMDQCTARLHEKAQKDRASREVEKQKELGLYKKDKFIIRMLKMIKKVLGL
jgi:uncharacterized protein involved in exopolysaccharide biosynthesis